MRRNRREKNEAGNQKYIAIAVLLCMVLLIFCSCGKKAAEEEVQEELLPEIVVGCNDYSPFCYIGTDGEAAGTDISLAKEAFQRMGYRARFRFIDWGGKEISCWKRAKLTAFGAASVWMDAKKNINGQVRICIRLSGPQ